VVSECQLIFTSTFTFIPISMFVSQCVHPAVNVKLTSSQPHFIHR